MPSRVHRIGALSPQIGLAERLLPNYCRRLAERSSTDLVRHVKRYTPVETGTLRDSIEEIPVRHPLPRVWTSGAKSELEYASFVEDGTLPHQIVPKQGDVLAFFWQGKTRFFRHVNHPGTPAFKMFQRGVIAERRSLNGIMRRVLMRWKHVSGL